MSSFDDRLPAAIGRSKGAARWAAQALLFALCLEIGARVDDVLTYGAPLWGRYDAEVLREVDPDGIPRNVPGARFQKWRINSLGFRGGEIARDKTPGRRRVICLGESESFGLYESEGGEWPARLARLLSSRHPDTDVINASVVGTDQRTRLAYLEKYLLPLQPDVVVLYINPRNEATELLGPYGERVNGTAQAAASGGLGLLQLRVWGKLKLRLMEALPDGVALTLRSWSTTRRLRELEESRLRGHRPLDVLPAEVVLSFEGYLRRLVLLLRAKGIEPILATYPTLVHEENHDQYLLYLSTERAYHIRFSEQGLIDIARKLNGVSRRVAADVAVPLVDADASIPMTTEYFADDVHYTDQGAARVAERVLDTLERTGVLR